MVPTFAAIIEKGRVVMRDQQAWISNLSTFKDGQAVIVTIKKLVKGRSIQQNKYLWGVVYALISEHTGYSANEVHEIMKRRHLPRKILTFQGKEYHMPGSTTRLSVGDMVEYVDRCIADAAELGINVPPPDGISL